MEASDVGRLGALSLLRASPADSVVTSYPIDDEEITIGRDPSCSLRLYYPAVSALHAKITFVERKAFLVVCGANGVLLDDSPLFPAVATAPGPTTVPLQNNSVIEVHKKRFRFTYPPKHLRSALINTPTQATPAPSRRPLRLSMIASAHVFTPGPSHDPQENLRVLQTPLRAPFARDEQEIVLVQSNSPRVVAEDKDLVILDEVEPEPVFPLPLPIMPQYPVTPVRRSRPSLHRAVLIRSAQRVAMQRDIQEEEEQDAEEVEETIAAISEEAEDDIEEIQPPEGQQQVSGWRKSIDMVKGSLGWAFRGLSVEPKEEEEEPALYAEDEDYPNNEDSEPEENEDFDYAHEEQEEELMPEAQDIDVDPSESQRPIGQFMTPQIPKIARQPRLSLGVAPQSGPRRVRVIPPWKVNEIEVPTTIKEESNNEQPSAAAASMSTPQTLTKREKLTEEEREAIRARRRSAVATPDNFFKGQTPGSRRTLFPSLAPLPSPSFVQGETTSTSSQLQSSAQDATSLSSSPSVSSASSSAKVEEEEDTAVLLARMKQMVEGVKQRQSLGRQSLSLSPRKREGGFSLLAPNHASTHRASRILIEEDEGDVPMHDHHETQAALPALQTPQMADLRHVFRRPRDEASTPALAGVREMFRPQPAAPTETPRMDGVNEMLSTPAGYHAPLAEEIVHGMDNDDSKEEEDESIEEPPVRTARGKRTPATRVVRRTAIPQSAPSKSTRAASQALEESESAELEDGPKVRRTRARTADGAVGQIPRATRGKATKTASPEPKEDGDEPAAVPTRAVRRTRQATDSSTTSSHADDTTTGTGTGTKPARKTRAKTPTRAAGASTAKTTVRKGTRAKPIEVTEDEKDDDDPIDTLPRERTPSGDVLTGRGRRGVGRSKSAVKQEDDEPAIPSEKSANETEAEQPARATRARRTPVPKIPTAVGTTGRGGRTRAAAASSAAAEPTIPEDKENTPEASPEDDGDEAKGAGASSKPRGTTKSTRTAAKGSSGKSTPGIGEEPTAPVVKTRVTRTRAARA
ncbi:hypothetical protein C8Q80DRAFT_1096959 [Daedaleopsis nitida]|nr:hypothetical protein C8Q80DRAFT_1096959 [Daedaleopsis nitida]